MVSEKQITPCPFSKHYRIDESHAWQSLTVFFLYRLTVGSVLVFLFFLGALPSSLGRYAPDLYATASCIYLASIFLSALPMLLRRPGFAIQAQLQVFADIALVPFIMHASGGVQSGVAVLLALSVAAGGILIGGRCAFLFSALASLAVLSAEIYADQTDAFRETHYTYAGMLGASYFGIALLAQVLAERAERSEAIAAQRGIDLANLQQLNAFIIRHLQSGILVVDEYQRIRMYNDSALRLLGAPPLLQPLELACPELAHRFREWLDNPGQAGASFKGANGSPVHVRFTRLGRTRPPITMIFVEDDALHNERVQQSKLASLGRLTASIAHEIRNPLAAISHASQLLAECPNLGPKDQRLTQIVLDHVARVNTVIENVLQISRRGQARREVMLLAPVLVKAVRDFEAEQRLDAAIFRLELRAEDALISVDSTHFKQILENLLSNALKYGDPRQGGIVVRAVRRQGEPCVEVIDHGSPIDPQTARQMFEPFFTTSASGTGLGLYIARELAELNQARLDYAPEPDGGCFRLYLCDAEKTVVEL
jgi:two-component system sensor histidine kinase PilS (NtrC family)